MATHPKTYISEEEYLAQEKTAHFKSEYYRGEVFPMTAQTPAHAQIIANTIACLRPEVRKKRCRMYDGSLHVKVSPTGLYTYPDVTVVCGGPQYEHDRDLIVNPTFICEVLSPSTQDYDRGKKFQSYRSIAGFREFVAIAQDEPFVEQYTRQDEVHWQLTEIKGIDQSIHLVILDCEIPLSAIYEDVEFNG